jgi:Fe-S cluster assembly protein SufD
MVAVRRRRSSTPSAPRYTRADVEALIKDNDEPQWLADMRLQAWETYEELPMPHREEEWRRTDYRHIRWDEVDSRISADGASIDAVPERNKEPLVGEQGGLMVFVDGKLVHHELDDELKQQGVIFSDLRSAASEHEAIVREHLMTKAVKPDTGKFAALHAALWGYGAFVHVPRNKSIEKPLHVVIYNTQAGTSMGHMLVHLGENAELAMQTEYASAEAETQSAFIGVTELIAEDAARLRYVSLQDWNRNTYEFAHKRAVVGRDANLDWMIGTMGARFAKDFIEVDIVGQGANARVSGFFFADKNQFYDLDTQQNHNAPLSTSDLLFKGAAKDNARTLWQGMIKSLPQMQKIDGYQVCRNLFLSDEARMDSIPGLEIEADDVACSHAATFGTLEAEPIFYLMSRGISENQAQLMVIDGFFDELLQRIPFERVRERLQAEIEAKILS